MSTKRREGVACAVRKGKDNEEKGRDIEEERRDIMRKRVKKKG